jgi:hypothetical protein
MIGGTAIALFLLIRGINSYGDMSPLGCTTFLYPYHLFIFKCHQVPALPTLRPDDTWAGVDCAGAAGKTFEPPGKPS